MLIAKIINKQIHFEHKHIAEELITKFEGQFVMVNIKKVARKRNLQQNAKLHAMITDISKQIEWAGKFRSVEDWKDILSAGYKIAAHNLEICPCPDSDKLVILGLHTSGLTVSEMADLVTYIYAFGNERQIIWSECT